MVYVFSKSALDRVAAGLVVGLCGIYISKELIIAVVFKKYGGRFLKAFLSLK